MYRNRLTARPIGIPNERIAQEEEDLAFSNDFLEGLIEDGDIFSIPNNALTVAKNVTVIRNLLMRRNGLSLYPKTKPNSNKILNIYAFYHTSTGINILRFTKSTIHKATASGWSAVTGAGLTGGDSNFFSFAIGDNRLFFSNGTEVIQEYNPTALTYAALGNAPKYKYICTAFNRVIGANRINVTNKPYEIGWSGDMNYGEWDPTVDISAGSSPLVDSPTDVNDDITGIFNLQSILTIPRQRSLWLANKQASATNPFNFFVASPRIGADVPRSIKLTEFGLMFFNYQHCTIYLWQPNADPIDVASTKVKRAIKAAITTPERVFADYSFNTKSYTIHVGNDNNNVVKSWTYHFDNKCWTYAEGTSIYAVDNLDFSSSSLTINELTGTINNLAGTIDSLSGISNNSTRFFGFTDGELMTQAIYSGRADESASIVSTDNGTSYTSDITSKAFTLPIADTHINLLQLIITPRSTGTITLEYSKDEGSTWTTAKSVTIVAGNVDKSYPIIYKKAIRARSFMWRITTANCMFILHRFNIRILRAGVSKE